MANAKEILKKTLTEIATKQDLENYQLHMEEISTEGANYSSVLFNAKILCSDKPDLKLFAKVASVAESLRTELNIDMYYAKEIYVYQELVKIYNDIQEKYNVPLEDRFVFPKFYGSNEARTEETIVLENLTEQRYTMYDRMKSVNWEFASKSVEELAKFHALAFAYKNEHPDSFPSNESSFNISNSMPFKDFSMFENMLQMIYAYLDENIKERLQKFVANHFTMEVALKYYGPSKWPVIAHGDYRASNIMFKRQGGKVKSLIPVDYQAVRLASPSTDILYFIYTGTDKEFRRVHLKHLLDHYYNTISKFLKLLNMDPEATFSRKDFDEEYKEMLPYGMFTTMFLLPMVLVDPANAPKMDVDGADMTNLLVKPNDSFKERFLPTIEEFMKLGVL